MTKNMTFTTSKNHSIFKKSQIKASKYKKISLIYKMKKKMIKKVTF